MPVSNLTACHMLSGCHTKDMEGKQENWLHQDGGILRFTAVDACLFYLSSVSQGRKGKCVPPTPTQSHIHQGTRVTLCTSLFSCSSESYVLYDKPVNMSLSFEFCES